MNSDLFDYEKTNTGKSENDIAYFFYEMRAALIMTHFFITCDFYLKTCRQRT